MVVQTRVAAEVATRRRMAPEAWRVFTENHVSEVVIPNCTQISEANMVQGLQDCCSGQCAPAHPRAVEFANCFLTLTRCWHGAAAG
jgi:hypothetical protein